MGIARDLMDAYAWGQADSGPRRGGWRYDWNTDADNSACQWWAIGGIAVERVLGIQLPQFVKDENLNFWIPATQQFTGTNTGLRDVRLRTPGEILEDLHEHEPSGWSR